MEKSFLIEFPEKLLTLETILALTIYQVVAFADLQQDEQLKKATL